MSRPSEKYRQRRLRRARLESLEKRELMAKDIASLLVINTENHFMSAEQWGSSILSSYVLRPVDTPAAPLGTVKPLVTEQATRDYLVDQLVNKWQHVFGKAIDAGLQRTAWHSDGNPFFGVMASSRDDGPSWTLSAADRLLPDTNKNNQVNGVDEPDRIAFSENGLVFIRSDVEYGQILVIDASDPSDLRQVATISTGLFSPQLHVVGNRLIAIGQPANFYFSQQIFPVEYPVSNPSEIRIFDIATPSQPRLTAKYQVEGTVVTSRVSGNRLTVALNERRELLKPTVIANDPSATYPTLPEQAVGRFENAAEYAVRIRPMVIEWLSNNVTELSDTGNITREAAQWDDLVITETSRLTQQASVITFDLSDSGLRLRDSEVVVGTWADQFAYVSANNVYLSQRDWSTSRTDIISLGITESSVDLHGIGSVPGSIRDARMMDEYKGDLRVFTNTIHMQDGQPRGSADLYVLRPVTGGKLSIVGQLTDIAEGQALYSALFMGEKAIITTGEATIDPLHGIDLSDPTRPVELSELAIPGASTFLQAIGSNHLIGLGFVFGTDGQWRRQVSLYEVSQLHDLKVLDTWVSQATVWANLTGRNQQALAVEYDAASGILTVPFESFGNGTVVEWLDRRETGLHIFKIDARAADPLTLIDEVGSSVHRSTLVGNKMLTFSEKILQSFQVQGKAVPLDQIFIGNPTSDDHLFIEFGATSKINVLANDVAGGQVQSIGGSSVGGTVTLANDGHTILYSAPDKFGDQNFVTDNVSYAVKYPSGQSFEGTLRVYVGFNHWRFEPPLDDPVIILAPDVPPLPVTPLPVTPPPVTPPPVTPPADPIVQETLVELSLQFQDDNGQVVSSLRLGEEYWLQLNATDRRTDPDGVFGAWVDLTFARGRLSVVGKPEGIGEFRNTVKGEWSGSDRISALGAFTKDLVFSRTATSQVARIRVKAETLGDLNLAASPTTSKLTEILLFGSNESVEPTQLDFVIPEVKVVDTHDANADGRVSPLDALIVISQLSKVRESAEGESPRVTTRFAAPTMQSRVAQMDISGDGHLSPVDVLLIVDYLNRQQTRNSAEQLRASGEADLEQTAVSTKAVSSLEESAVTEQSDNLVEVLACNFLEHDELLRKSRRQTV